MGKLVKRSPDDQVQPGSGLLRQVTSEIGIGVNVEGPVGEVVPDVSHLAPIQRAAHVAHESLSRLVALLVPSRNDGNNGNNKNYRNNYGNDEIANKTNAHRKPHYEHQGEHCVVLTMVV